MALDGDTVTLLTPGQKEVKVRLQGIDAPELKQPFGNASKQALSSMVFGKPVAVEMKGKDQYGRTLGEIFVNEKAVKLQMVKLGMAWQYVQYSHDPQLAAAEAKARGARAGLWRADRPVPPWTWRHDRAAR